MRNCPLLLLIIICLLLHTSYVYSQNDGDMPMVQKLGKHKIIIDSLFYLTDTTGASTLPANFILLGTKQQNCKSRVFIFGKIQKPGSYVYGFMPGDAPGVYNPKKVPFLQIHGNVTYEGLYQSNIDTPFIERNIYQHTLHTDLEVTLKDQYPFRVNFTTRFSNSPLFKNFTDFNLRYTSQDFKNKLRDIIERWSNQQMAKQQDLDKLAAVIAAKRSSIDSLRNFLSPQSILQMLVEEQERKMYKFAQPDSNGKQSTYGSALTQANKVNGLYSSRGGLNAGMAASLIRKKLHPGANDTTKLTQGTPNTTVQNSTAFIEGKQKKYDSLLVEVTRLDSTYQLQKMKLTQLRDSVLNQVSLAKDAGQMASAIKPLNMPDSALPKGYSNLLALRSLTVGRSVVNYSELTAKNISLQGVQAEYNPSSYYLAFAAGMVDYRFRDFIVTGSKPLQQYLTIVRYGKGIKDGNHLFFTYYTGKKQLYNYSTDSISQNVPRYSLMGMALENRYQISKSSYIVAEVAKSSVPYYNIQQGKKGIVATTFNFNDRSNEAYSIKFTSFIPATFTKLNAYYTHYGANFQSFSLFTTSSEQNAWYIKAEQPFFKKVLDVTASVKKNDFSNPYINQSFYTNTIFKSIQATLRIKNLPVLSAGYYPSSQLTKLGTDQYVENLFYTFIATASHFYRYHNVMMNTIVNYTRFYNRAADSSFVYFNTSNFLVSQSFYLAKFTLQFDGSTAVNSNYNLYALGGNIQYKINNWLLLGGGIKYNRQTVFNNTQLGYTANTTVKIPGVGDVEFMVQKAYMPGIDKQLVENDIGRLIYYKTF